MLGRGGRLPSQGFSTATTRDLKFERVVDSLPKQGPTIVPPYWYPPIGTPESIPERGYHPKLLVPPSPDLNWTQDTDLKPSETPQNCCKLAKSHVLRPSEILQNASNSLKNRVLRPSETLQNALNLAENQLNLSCLGRNHCRSRLTAPERCRQYSSSMSPFAPELKQLVPRSSQLDNTGKRSKEVNEMCY